MKRRRVAGVGGLALGLILTGTPAFSQSQRPTEGPAHDGSPAWFLQGSFPDPGGRTIVDSDGIVTIVPRSDAGGYRTAAAGTPRCSHSPICGNRLGRRRQELQRVQWEQTLGYTFTYPYVLPPGLGGVPAVALDSRGNLWVFQRSATRQYRVEFSRDRDA